MPVLRRAIPSLILVLVLSLVYAITLAPDITWANRGADGGDLITAAATGGVPHPPGYPTYLALARLFQFLPLGTLAFRTNLLSAVCGLLSAVLVTDLVRRSYGGDATIGRWAGFVAGLGFGLSPLLWSQAVITEVYTLHALFVALILWLLPFTPGTRFLQGTGFLRSAWLDRLSGLMFGLALGNQVTVAFLLPPWLFVTLINGTRINTDKHGFNFNYLSVKSVSAEGAHSVRVPKLKWRSLIRRLGWLLLGMLIYLTLIIRARSGSPVNWGNPSTLESLWWIVSGQYYQWRVFALPVYNLWPRLLDWAKLLGDQFGWLGLALALYGFGFSKPRWTRYRWITGWVFISFAVFALGYSTLDAYVLLIPAFMMVALWLGLGAAGLLEKVSGWREARAWITPVGGILLAMMVLANAWANLPHVDASQDQRATNFGRKILETAPQDAVLYTLDDEDTFPLWYYHFALGERPDLAILQIRLLPEDWYRQTMRATYPGLVIPEQVDRIWYLAVMAANPNRPNCETLLDKPEVFTCKP